jgi:hypothetical protein
MKASHADIRNMLGDKAALFNQNGINFLKCRYNGTDNELTKKLMDVIVNDSLELDDDLHKKMAEFFGYEPTAPSVAVFLLGRMPSRARSGDEWGSSSRSLTPEQEEVANLIADGINNGERYKNRRRQIAATADATATPTEVVETPAPASTEKPKSKKSKKTVAEEVASA